MEMHHTTPTSTHHVSRRRTRGETVSVASDTLARLTDMANQGGVTVEEVVDAMSYMAEHFETAWRIRQALR